MSADCIAWLGKVASAHKVRARHPARQRLCLWHVQWRVQCLEIANQPQELKKNFDPNCMAQEALRKAAIAALTEYLGLAAEFIVDDAFEGVAKTDAFKRDPKLQEMYFFICLDKLLPPEVPFAKLKLDIVKAAGI